MQHLKQQILAMQHKINKQEIKYFKTVSNVLDKFRYKN